MAKILRVIFGIPILEVDSIKEFSGRLAIEPSVLKKKLFLLENRSGYTFKI